MIVRSKPKLKVNRQHCLVVASILFLHFMLVRLGGFPLTIAPFAAILFLVWNYRLRMSKVALLLGLSLLALPPLVHVPSFFSSLTDPQEYLRTFLLWCFNATIIWLALKSRIERDRSHILLRAVYVALASVSIFVLLQVLLANFLQVTLLYNLFGNHQYMSPYSLHTLEFSNGNLRGPGLYLEPSFCALVLYTLFTITFLARYRLVPSIVLTALGIAATGSASGILAFVITLALGTMVTRKAPAMNRWVMIGLVAVSVTGIILLLGSYLASRFFQLNASGTSTYYRLVAPLAVLGDVLRHFPLGAPFGSVERFLGSYQLMNGSNEGKSIDNGSYLIIFYFGWLGLVANLGIVAKAITSFLEKRRELMLVMLYMFLSLQFNGGILLPEYAFLLCLVLYQFRTSSESRPQSALFQR